LQEDCEDSKDIIHFMHNDFINKLLNNFNVCKMWRENRYVIHFL